MGNFKSELSNYQNVPRELVFDKTLSDRARFVYVFMACKPDGWDFFLEPMSKDIGYSVDTLRKYLNELVASGWLVKGEQSNEHGVFGAVEYTLKATKFTDTEKCRHGKNTTQENIDNISLPNTKDTLNREKEKEEKEINKELFEQCWIAYRRKGSKKKAFEIWCKLNDVERQNVLPHIKPYVASREMNYQKDFERYLRDKIFLDVVFKNNSVIYDPVRLKSVAYTPQGRSIWFDESTKSYWTDDNFYYGVISDGYTDEDRPDGATLTMSNARGIITWNSSTKKWEKR